MCVYTYKIQHIYKNHIFQLHDIHYTWENDEQIMKEK